MSKMFIFFESFVLNNEGVVKYSTFLNIWLGSKNIFKNIYQSFLRSKNFKIFYFIFIFLKNILKILFYENLI